MKKRYFLFIFCCMIFSCKQSVENQTKKAMAETGKAIAETGKAISKTGETLTEVVDGLSSDWKYIFDGTSTKGWRAYNGDVLPSQWLIKNGALTFDAEGKLEKDFEGGQDIIYAEEEFEEFDLYLEWKLSEGGNSGIFYHLKEGYEAPWQVSPEYQLLDDDGWERINKDKLEPWQKAGADYAMYTPDLKNKVLHPAGEWNSSRIKYTNEKVEHYLNEKLILSFVPNSDDWKKRKVEGKWKDYPEYGSKPKGFIGLQDHDSPIWFKNIKIKKL